jgi:hypothetical protein
MIVPIPTDPEAQREIVKTAAKYCDLILTKPFEEFGGLLGEQIGHWKLMNRVRCLAKAKKYMEEKEVDPTKLLPDVFVPLIEEAGNTEDETLSDMFAQLLATHLDENAQDKVHPSFAKILGQLAPLDAKVLNLTAKTEREARQHWGDTFIDNNAPSPTKVQDFLVEKFGEGIRNSFDLSIENLDRLGLLTVTKSVFGDGTPGVRMTAFGMRLVQVCAGQ